MGRVKITITLTFGRESSFFLSSSVLYFMNFTCKSIKQKLFYLFASVTFFTINQEKKTN